MNLEEFQKKWKGIRTAHKNDCPADGDDFMPCNCGLDALWKQRNADLSTVPPEELNAWHEKLIKEARERCPQ